MNEQYYLPNSSAIELSGVFGFGFNDPPKIKMEVYQHEFPNLCQLLSDYIMQGTDIPLIQEKAGYTFKYKELRVE